VAGIDADASKIMIYPNSSKDKETAEYPYVELSEILQQRYVDQTAQL
jgi:hypothetical protein